MVRQSLSLLVDIGNPNLAEIEEKLSNFWIVFDYFLN
jgi:hypothetical protein